MLVGDSILRHRILIANTLYPTPLYPDVIGGAEKSVRLLAESLVVRGHSVEAIRALPPHAEPHTEEVNGVKVYGAPLSNAYWFSDRARSGAEKLIWHLRDDWNSAPQTLEQRLDEFRPTVLHTNNLVGISTASWLVARRRRVPIVHTLRDYALMCPRATLFKNQSICKGACPSCRMTTLARRRRSRAVDVVVGVSRATLELHRGVGLFTRARGSLVIGSIPEVDPAEIKSAPRSKRGYVTFGYIGRIAPEKGLNDLVRAFATLPDGAAKLVVAGSVSAAEVEELEKLAGGANVEFVGFVQPRAFYESVDIVVVPSLWHEPLPRAAVDAVAFGRPVIGSARGGIPEALGDPPFGIVYEPSDPEALAQALRTCLSAAFPARPPSEHVDVVGQYLEAYDMALENAPASREL
jgi:glycosyltransferase involved in cell wall biosynthesis